MFGYRLMREADYAELRRELADVRAQLLCAHLEHARALGDMAEAKATAAARASANDHLTMQLNTVSMEVGQLRAKITGIPSIVPQIGKGSPLSAESIGAGVDLFSDVGDERARDLAARGLLHDTPEIAVPTAAALSGSIEGDTTP